MVIIHKPYCILIIRPTFLQFSAAFIPRSETPQIGLLTRGQTLVVLVVVSEQRYEQ